MPAPSRFAEPKLTVKILSFKPFEVSGTDDGGSAPASKIQVRVTGPSVMSFQAKNVIDWSIDDSDSAKKIRPIPLREGCNCAWVMRSHGYQDDLFAPREWEFWVVVEHPPEHGKRFHLEFGAQYYEEVTPNAPPEFTAVVGDKLPGLILTIQNLV